MKTMMDSELYIWIDCKEKSSSFSCCDVWLEIEEEGRRNGRVSGLQAIIINI
jgi:hypothetical protein